MDSKSDDGKTTRPRKVKFAPKAPPRRVAKVEVKSEPVEDESEAQAKDLMRRINEKAMKVKPKTEKKVPASQVAWFGGVANSSTRTYGNYAYDSSSNSSCGRNHGGLSMHPEKEYKEPWDYYSYYPVTLPLRRPYSGDPDILDEQEFGKGALTAKYDENSIKAAEELGLMEDSGDPSLFFIQLPELPMLKQSTTSDGPSGSKPSGGSQQKICRMDEMPEGFMGKLRVYKSGRVKLQLGDMLYDVNPGLNGGFAQDVAVINIAEKHCCVVGELNKFAVLTPDLDSILDGLDEYDS